MSGFFDEIERLRQRMIDEARTGEVELIRLAADLEKLELSLIDQLRTMREAHEQRREFFLEEMRRFADEIMPPRNAQRVASAPPRLSERQWGADEEPPRQSTANAHPH